MSYNKKNVALVILLTPITYILGSLVLYLISNYLYNSYFFHNSYLSYFLTATLVVNSLIFSLPLLLYGLYCLFISKKDTLVGLLSFFYGLFMFIYPVILLKVYPNQAGCYVEDLYLSFRIITYAVLLIAGLINSMMIIFNKKLQPKDLKAGIWYLLGTLIIYVPVMLYFIITGLCIYVGPY